MGVAGLILVLALIGLLCYSFYQLHESLYGELTPEQEAEYQAEIEARRKRRAELEAGAERRESDDDDMMLLRADETRIFLKEIVALGPDVRVSQIENYEEKLKNIDDISCLLTRKDD